MTREERQAEALRLRGEGLSYYAIAKLLGSSLNTVKGWFEPEFKARLLAASNAYKTKNRAKIRERDRQYRAQGGPREEAPFYRFLRETA